MTDLRRTPRRILLATLLGASVGCGDDGGGEADGDGTSTGFVDDTDEPGGSDSSGDETGESLGEAPSFGGISLAYTPAPQQVELEWLPAVDDTTAPEDIRYHVYTGGWNLLADVEAGQAPDVTLTGETKYSFGGLPGDVEAYFLVVATDEDDNDNALNRVVALAPLLTPIVAKEIPIDLADLDLDVSEDGLNQFTLTGADAGAIDTGALIIVQNTFGRSLRRVLSSDADGAGNHIVTAKASLSDAIESGTIRVSTSVADADVALERRIVLDGPSDLGRTAAVTSTSRGNIEVETRDYGSAAIPPGVSAATTTLEDGVTLEYTLTAGIDIKSESHWEKSIVDTPAYVRVTAEGMLAVDALAAYNLDAAVEYERSKELYAKTLNFRYVVGGIPVWQEATIKLMGDLSLAATGGLDMQLRGHAEKSVTFGFEWTEQSGFKPISEEGFENEVTFTLEGQANATGSLRVYPVISTRLYSAAGVELFVVPEIKLDAHARLLPLPVEMTKFDVDFLVQAYAKADLTIFGKTLAAWESDKVELLHIPIYSLPEIKLRRSTAQLDTCGSRRVHLLLAQGYGNEVLPENITWTVEDPAGELTIMPGNHLAEFTADTPGDYLLVVSAHGDGFLGELGTRYAATTVNVAAPPPGDCDPANSDGGAGDILSCGVDVWNGLMDAPFPTKNTVEVGEQFRYVLPSYCGTDCNIQGYVVAYDTGAEPEGIDFFGYGAESGNETLESTTLSVDRPGTWHPVIKYEVYHPSGGTLDYAYYAAEGELQPDFSTVVTFPTTYTQWLAETHDWQQGVSGSDCTGDSGMPVHPVRVVAPYPDEDDNDTPAAARSVGINGPGSVARGLDDDFFTFTDTPGPHYDALYDSDEPIVDCELLIEAPGRSIALFDDEAAALAGTPVLIEGADQVVYDTAPLQEYFVKITGGPGRQTYELRIGNDCTPR